MDEIDDVGGDAVPMQSANPSVPLPYLRDDGKLMYDSMLVGTFIDGALVVDLGWCRAAGVRVTIKADPAQDRQRSGIVLER